MTKKKLIWIGIGVFVLMPILFSLVMVSISQTPKEEVILKAAQTEIKGDLKGSYEVVDKNYKVKYTTHSSFVVVELKRTSKPLPYNRKDVVIFPEAEQSSAKNCAGFGIEILDVEGDVIAKTAANATPYSWDEMTAALQLLPDETSTISFYSSSLPRATSFRITSLVQPNDKKKEKPKTSTESLFEAALEAAETIDEKDLEKAQKNAEAALKMAGETAELAGKMLELLGE